MADIRTSIATTKDDMRVSSKAADGGSGRHDLTVCTVSYHNARHLEVNWQLAHQRTVGPRPIRWIVAENTPPGGSERLQLDPQGRQWLTVLPGANTKLPPNLHHAVALHKCLEKVETRFLLVLDPDFYIVWGEWASCVIDYMVARNLAIFGAPWHPKHGFKYRYFPCVHCVFMDLEKIPLRTIDFRPPSLEDLDSPGNPKNRFLDIMLSFTGLFHRRSAPTDTGTLFYLRYHNDKSIKFECVTPVYRLRQDRPEFGKTIRSRFLQKVLPDHLCYVPKKKGAFTDQGFSELGHNLDMPRAWEEFVWQGAPFGFHVRRNARKDSRDEQKEIGILERTIEILFKEQQTISR